MSENLRFEAMSPWNPDFFAKKSLILASSAAGGSKGTRPLAPVKCFQTFCTEKPPLHGTRGGFSFRRLVYCQVRISAGHVNWRLPAEPAVPPPRKQRAV